MDELQRQVRRAQRRLALQRLAVALGWCWFVGLLAAAALIAVDKFHCLGIAAWGWAVGALGVGLLAALGWAIWTWRKPLDAAIEIDRRYHSQRTSLQHPGHAGRPPGERGGPGAGG